MSYNTPMMITPVIPACFACGIRYHLLPLDGEPMAAVCWDCLDIIVNSELKDAS